MHEVEANKKAWGLLSRDHYETFRKRLRESDTLLSDIIRGELGDVAGKSLIHLQCNVGADTICLARMGARVTGVDLVPDNIHYARQLAQELGVTDATFIQANVLELMELHDQRYDIVFTSEGAIGWLPDLRRWAQTVRYLLSDEGFFYILDSHPFFLVFDEERLKENQLVAKYPYFVKRADKADTIGGYASEAKAGENYFWMYTIGEVLNALIEAGLAIEYLHEHDTLYYDAGGMERLDGGQYRPAGWEKLLPLSFSLRAAVRR